MSNPGTVHMVAGQRIRLYFSKAKIFQGILDSPIPIPIPTFLLDSTDAATAAMSGDASPSASAGAPFLLPA